MSELQDVANRLFRAIEQADGAELDALYDDAIEVHHNVAPTAQSKADNIALLLGVAAGGRVRYLDAVRWTAGRTVIQRHRMRFDVPGGASFEFPIAIFIDVNEHGRIARIHEYFDGAAVAALLAEIGLGFGEQQ